MHFVIIEDDVRSRKHLMEKIQNYCIASDIDADFSCYDKVAEFITNFQQEMPATIVIQGKRSDSFFIEVKESLGSGASIQRTVMLRDLIYAETVRNGLIIHTTMGKIRTIQSLTFSKLISLLPDNGQFAIFSRGMTVNFLHVNDITKYGEIHLKNNQTLYCSRRKCKEICMAFSDYRSNM